MQSNKIRMTILFIKVLFGNQKYHTNVHFPCPQKIGYEGFNNTVIHMLWITYLYKAITTTLYLGELIFTTMSLTTLKDDLLEEFREERIMIKEQIELLDPLATQMRKPAAQRLLSSGTLIVSEIICYVASLGGLAFIGFMHRIYPFNQLRGMLYSTGVRNNVGGLNLIYLTLCIYGLAAIGVILIFIVGRMAREIRLKNQILSLAGRDIKTIVGQHLERKAALDTIEQRHMLGLSGVSMQPPKQHETKVETPTAAFRLSGLGGINEIPNPGFQ